MDWLWPIYKEHVERSLPSDSDAATHFMRCLAQSTATAFAMEPVGDTIRFKGLGRWPLPEVTDLVADPNAFVADRFGGGKFKINFHHGDSFVGTHNFRTYGVQRWRQLPEVEDLL